MFLPFYYNLILGSSIQWKIWMTGSLATLSSATSLIKLKLWAFHYPWLFPDVEIRWKARWRAEKKNVMDFMLDCERKRNLSILRCKKLNAYFILLLIHSTGFVLSKLYTYVVRSLNWDVFLSGNMSERLAKKWNTFSIIKC